MYKLMKPHLDFILFQASASELAALALKLLLLLPFSSLFVPLPSSRVCPSISLFLSTHACIYINII